MRLAARVHAAPKGPSPAAPPARRPQGQQLLASRAAGFGSPEEGTARRHPPLAPAPPRSPLPFGSDGGDTPQPQVSICPAWLAAWTVGVPAAPNTPSRQSLSGACLVSTSGARGACTRASHAFASYRAPV